MKIFQKKWIKLVLLLAFCGTLIGGIYLDAITLWAKEVQIEEQGYGTDYRNSLVFKGMAAMRDAYGIEGLCEMEEERLRLQEEAIRIDEYVVASEGENPTQTGEMDATTWGDFFKSQGMDGLKWIENVDNELEGCIICQGVNISQEKNFARISGKEFAKLLETCSYERLYSEEGRNELTVRLETEGVDIEYEDIDIEYEGEIYSGDSVEEIYRSYAESRLHELLNQCIEFDWDWAETYVNDIEYLRLYEAGDSFLLYDEKEGVIIGNRMQRTRLLDIEKSEFVYLPVKNVSAGSEEADWAAMLANGFTSSLVEQLRYELYLNTGEWREYVHHNYLKAITIEKVGETFINLGRTGEDDVCVSFLTKEELAYVFGKNSDVYENQYKIYLYYDESYFDSPEEKLYEFFYNDYSRHGDRSGLAVVVSVIAVLLGILTLISFVSALWRREEEKLRDRVLIEVNILFTIAVIIGCTGALYGIAVLLSEVFLLYFNTGGVLLGGAILGEFVVLLGIAVLYQLISTIVFRIRKRCFLRSWLAGRFGYWIYTKLKRVAQNMDILKRRILLLVGFGFISFIAMLVLCICTINVAGFIGVFGMFCYIAFMIGFSYIFLKDAVDNKRLLDGCNQMKNGMFDKKIETSNLYFDKLELAEAINTMGEGLEKAVSTSMKDERMKTELITNVSHDIKTPLTSIINYVDLLKRENLTPEEQQEYLKVLDTKSQRLKQLIEDLIEVSKTTSGNIELQLVNLDFKELLNQAIGEFEEKFAERNLELVVTCADHKIQIWADGRRCYRILENLFSNVFKYAMPHTRVYVDLQQEANQMVFTLKNISEAPLNVAVEELMERFVRGDVSRSTSGSGLGLSIAQNLVNLQQGKLEIKLDGDLFKVEIRFPIVP